MINAPTEAGGLFSFLVIVAVIVVLAAIVFLGIVREIRHRRDQRAIVEAATDLITQHVIKDTPRTRAVKAWQKEKREVEKILAAPRTGACQVGGDPVFIPRGRRDQPQRAKRHGGRTWKSWRCQHGPGGPRV